MTTADDSITRPEPPLCACGCGDRVKINRDGKPNRYLSGHARRGVSPSAEHRAKISAANKGKPGYWLGKSIPADARKRMSESAKRKRLSPEHKRKIGQAIAGRVVSEKTRAKMRGRKASAETLQKKRLAQLGPKGSGWKGGLSSENEKARASSRFREWRLAVFRRDGFACAECGTHRQIHAHHIKPFAKFVDLRFEVSNGLTLCKYHHDIIHGRVKCNQPSTQKYHHDIIHGRVKCNQPSTQTASL